MSSSRTSKVMALSLGQALTAVAGLVSGMVMSRVLSKTDLATYRQTLLAYQVAIPLLSLGIPSAIYYFLPTEKERVRGVVVDALVLLMLTGLLYALFIALGGHHLLARRFSNPAIVSTLAYLVPLPLVMLPASLVSSVLVVQNRVRQLTVYNVLSNLMLASGIIFACAWWKTPEAMVLTKVGISLLSGLVAIHLMHRAVPEDGWTPQWAGMKRMVTYSIPLVAASAMGSISLQLDKLIVSSMCSPEDFAVYSNGAIQIPLVGILTGSIAAVILPDLRRLAAANDAAGALALFRTSAAKSAAVLIPVMMFLLASAEPFILTLFSEKYAGSVLPFRLYLLILPMRIVFFGTFLMAFGWTRTILHRSAAGLAANALLSILLVRWMGFIGAIVATMFSLYLVEGVWNYAAISRIARCRWRDVIPFRTVIQLAGISAAAALPVLGLALAGPPMPSVARLGLNAGLFGAFLMGLAWWFEIDVLKVEAKRWWAKGWGWLRPGAE
ncbi:MAG: oligosaccharide flippase family protein [Lentisphaerae bacterium]|nr:oligosaccharide flippase family protein [Lentisphaerota bacterium]